MQAEKYSLAETLSPDDYVINIIRRAVINSQNILIDAQHHGRITLISSDGEYFADIEYPQSFFTLPASRFKVTVLNDDKIKHFKTSVGRNIDELLWQAGYYASDGRLLEGSNWNDVLELNSWPNFTRIPTSPSFLRLAALLAKQATSIEVSISSLHIKREEAYQFYAAASCSGLVNVVNHPPRELNLKPHRNHALLGLLLEKIAHI